ncbi:hypothetical protein EXIGLDRAFT_771167 [Exidia glandulosa HHB12029]|uniref:Uncharacterized protein n=1 Tax=Exidia glandulosa HHB12029 TaxID=1314781 RepID=A0A166AAB1_EXIGL|nr:hypothetical protein EXIGLDRAFT_771167 [Exidia glandulosa HHB12029]
MLRVCTVLRNVMMWCDAKSGIAVSLLALALTVPSPAMVPRPAWFPPSPPSPAPSPLHRSAESQQRREELGVFEIARINSIRDQVRRARKDRPRLGQYWPRLVHIDGSWRQHDMVTADWERTKELRMMAPTKLSWTEQASAAHEVSCADCLQERMERETEARRKELEAEREQAVAEGRAWSPPPFPAWVQQELAVLPPEQAQFLLAPGPPPWVIVRDVLPAPAPAPAGVGAATLPPPPAAPAPAPAAPAPAAPAPAAPAPAAPAPAAPAPAAPEPRLSASGWPIEDLVGGPWSHGQWTDPLDEPGALDSAWGRPRAPTPFPEEPIVDSRVPLGFGRSAQPPPPPPLISWRTPPPSPRPVYPPLPGEITPDMPEYVAPDISYEGGRRPMTPVDAPGPLVSFLLEDGTTSAPRPLLWHPRVYRRERWHEVCDRAKGDYRVMQSRCKKAGCLPHWPCRKCKRHPASQFFLLGETWQPSNEPGDNPDDFEGHNFECATECGSVLDPLSDREFSSGSDMEED